MKEEDKKAIENLTEYAYATYDFVLKAKDAITVLNLIETQKAEIDAKRFDIETLKEERENDINKIDKLQVELEKRDREINRLKDELGYTRKVVEGEKKDNAQKKEI